jgi:hypothetical protein
MYLSTFISVKSEKGTYIEVKLIEINCDSIQAFLVLIRLIWSNIYLFGSVYKFIVVIAFKCFCILSLNIPL